MDLQTYHNVPSTSNTMPFNFGRSRPCVASGLKGANRFGFRLFAASVFVDVEFDIATSCGLESSRR